MSCLRNVEKFRSTLPSLYAKIDALFLGPYCSSKNGLPQPTLLRRFWIPKTEIVRAALENALGSVCFASKKKDAIDRDADLYAQAVKAWSSFNTLQKGFKEIDKAIDAVESKDINQSELEVQIHDNI